MDSDALGKLEPEAQLAVPIPVEQKLDRDSPLTISPQRILRGVQKLLIRVAQLYRDENGNPILASRVLVGALVVDGTALKAGPTAVLHPDQLTFTCHRVPLLRPSRFAWRVKIR